MSKKENYTLYTIPYTNHTDGTNPYTVLTTGKLLTGANIVDQLTWSTEQ